MSDPSATPPRPSWLRADGPNLMAIVNVNPDSFSDPHRDGPPDHVRQGVEAVAAGATVVDLGAQSAALAARLVPPAEQTAALVPVVRDLAERGIVVSVDTYEPDVARATLDAGATIVNDYSGRCDPDLVAATVEAGAWYVLTHNPVGPRRRQTDPDRYGGDVAGAVRAYFEDTLRRLADEGLAASRVILDPGVDVSKTPAQSLALLRDAERVRADFDNPLLWAVSRKDVIGVLAQRRPSRRDPGTLALVGWFAGHRDTLLRVHDVAAAVDHLAVVDALDGRRDLAPDAVLDDRLRREDG